MKDFKELSRREKRVAEDLAEYIAKDLVKQGQEQASDCQKVLHVKDDEDLEGLATLASKIQAAVGSEQPRDHFFVLAGNNTAGGSSPLLAIGTDTRVSKLADALRKEFGSQLKGGGKGRWQGKLEGKWNKAQIQRLSALLDAI